MCIFTIILLFILLWNIRFVPAINEEYLSSETCQLLKGFFALVVILHHLALKTPHTPFFSFFGAIGHMAVAVFFFISGYGLQKKHLMSENYDKHFLSKRIPKILLPYMIMSVVYWLCYAIDGRVYSLELIFTYLLGGELLVSYSWYIIDILYFYLSFCLLMKLSGRNKGYIICGAVLSYILLVHIYVKADFEAWWYNTAHLFVIGIIWATYERKLTEFIASHHSIAKFILIPAFLVSFFVQTETYDNFMIELSTTIISAVLFVIVVIIFSTKFKFGNRVLSFAGKISFELYLSHGLFIFFLRSSVIYVQNDLLWSALVVLLSLIFSYFFHIFCKFILSQYYKHVF